MSFPFSRWRLQSLNTTSSFAFVDVLAFRRSKLMVNIISIYGWDITTSGLKKQTSTILEFYYRFRSRPFSRNLHFILHQPAEFRPNRKYNNVISIIQDGGRNGWILLPVSYLSMSLPSEGQSILANQLLSIYLQIAAKINNFRFRNTNVRHIGILLLISTSTSSP